MKIKITLFALSILFIVSCGNKTSKNAETSEEAAILQSAGILAEHPGKEVYNSVCMACHMEDGSGEPGMFPPIANSEYVNGPADVLIKIILEGMTGKIEIDGEEYDNVMPPHSHLSNKQIADLLTYIRSDFGNNSPEIKPEDVEKMR
jgi:mono/diheme cytochrome c family protein